MKTVYAIASARTIKYLTGAKAGKVSHTLEIKKVWDENKKLYSFGFDTIEEAVEYMNKRKRSYLSQVDQFDRPEWELVTDCHPGYFVVKSTWGKKSKGETIDSWNIVPLVIE